MWPVLVLYSPILVSVCEITMNMKFEHLTSIESKWKTMPLYEASFPEDHGAYAAYYYQWKCRDNEVLVLTTLTSSDSLRKEESREEICAMLHLNPYRMWISTRSVPLHYIVAVATALPYRRQGCMRTLMKRAFAWMYKQEEPFTYLMPADTIYYKPFGFRVIYEQKPVSFPANLEEANRKAIEQFDVATLRDEDYIRFLDSEPKEDIETSFDKNDWKPQIMCRIIHVVRLLECLRAVGWQKIYLFIQDALIWENAGWYCWQVDQYVSKVQRLESCPADISPDTPPMMQGDTKVSCLKIDVEELTEQLFGISPLHPALSQIKILKRICINEEV